jgi:hypothetical protein
MKKIYLVLLLLLTACGGGPRAVPRNGSVKFTVDGQSIEWDGMQFEIQPNALKGYAASALHEEITSIKKGKNDFGFWIRTTQEAAQKQSESIKKSGSHWRTLEFVWWADSDSPIDTLRATSKINHENAREMQWDIQIPENNLALSTKTADPHTMQMVSQSDSEIRFDDVSDDRVRGHFSGTVYAHVLGNSLDSRQTLINGEFDLPVVKLYRYE